MGLDLYFYKRRKEILSLNSKGYYALISFLDLPPYVDNLLEKEGIKKIILQCEKIYKKGKEGINEFRKNNTLVFDNIYYSGYTKKEDEDVILYYTIELKRSLEFILKNMKRDEVIKLFYDE